MAENKMYHLIEKTKENTDKALETANRNNELLVSIDSRLASIPQSANAPDSPNAMPRNLTVELPPTIATISSVREICTELLKKYSGQTQVSVAVDLTKFSNDFVKVILPNLVPVIKDKVEETISKSIDQKLPKAIDNGLNRHRLGLKESDDRLRSHMYKVLQGSLWAATPNWIKWTVFGVIVYAGLATWFSVDQYKENRKLDDTEWLYRYERMGYPMGKSFERLQERERIFSIGTYQEQDSLRNFIRQVEQHPEYKKPHPYFAPVTE